MPGELVPVRRVSCMSCGSTSWLMNHTAFERLRAYMREYILTMFAVFTVAAVCAASAAWLTRAAELRMPSG
jgi:hypothetical protein